MSKLKKAVVVVLVVIMAISGLLIVQETGRRKQEEAAFEQIRQEMSSEAETEAAETEAAETEPAETSTYEAPQALQELMSKYSDCIGYIEIKDTNVSYPIMQSENNEYYLHRDMDGNDSNVGCIYMDANHDISDKGLHVIYGHHMRNGSMFKDVSKYVSEEYMESHQDITIWTADHELKLKPVYCYADSADGSYRSILTKRGELVDFIKTHTGQEIDTNDLYVLITCSYGGHEDERTYVYCVPEE